MLAALNGSYDFGRDRRALAVLFRLTPAGEEQYEIASQEFRNLLRQYVDMWLETGREPDSTERPCGRRPTMEIAAIVSGYLRTHPALPVNFDKGYRVAIPFRIESFPSLQPKEPATFRQLPGGGRARIVEGEHEPCKDVMEHAQRLFVGMLFQEWAMRIAKCRRRQCGRYYVLNKPRAVYKRGTFCRRCSSLQSAAERTTARRREEHEARLRIASAAYDAWYRKGAKGPQRLGPLAKYIAWELCRRNKNVKSKWATRNMKQIEAKAKTKA